MNRKLLFVVNSWENGAIPHILLELAPHLRDWGWSLRFLAIEPLPEDHRSVRRCRDEGFELHSLNLSPKSIFSAIRALRKAIRDFGPDLIHTHLGRADVLTPWAKGSVPQVTTFHSVRPNYNRLTLAGYRWTDSKVALRTGVSYASIHSFYEDGFLKSPHKVIYNPINPDRLKPRVEKVELWKRFGFENRSPHLVTVGRLIPVKNHLNLIESVALLRNEFPSISLAIVGDGPLREALQARIDDLRLSDAVALVGSYDNVADFYAASDLLVFPSFWEGLGLVPLEAMAVGTPVAGSSIPALEEFISKGVTGTFFDPHDVRSIASAIRAVVDDPLHAQEMTVQAKKMVEERFAVRRIAEKYHQSYLEVLNQ